MHRSRTNILMTGAGAPGAPGIIKCLLQDPSIQLTVADIDGGAVGRYLAHDFVTIPKGDDPSFIPALLEICTGREVQLILPLVTRELEALSSNRSAFLSIGTKILVSDAEAIRIANNKLTCYSFLREKGIAVPEFFPAATTEEFIHAAASLGHPHRPFVFKPAQGNGSRGVRVVSDSLDEADLLFLEKPYQLFISYPHALRLLTAKHFPQLVVSEYLPGDEYSVDCLASHGKASLVVPRLRTKMINGISVRGEFVRDQEIIDYCRAIIDAIGLHGNVGIQVKKDQSGKPLLLEINPRVQGTIVAALGAGVNLPLEAVKQELGTPCSLDDSSVKWGTRFVRYWTEVFY
jgi:carbamoyl-phosphate synthase large subunit